MMNKTNGGTEAHTQVKVGVGVEERCTPLHGDSFIFYLKKKKFKKGSKGLSIVIASDRGIILKESE